jgi:hypothetical protein
MTDQSSCGLWRAEAAHSTYERCRAADGEMHKVALVLTRMDDHAGVNSGERGALVLGHAQVGFNDGIGVERGVDGGEHRIQSFAGQS